MLTLDPCCSLTFYFSNPDIDPLTSYFALTLDQAHPRGLIWDPWTEAGPGPCHCSCHIHLTGHNRMAPISVALTGQPGHHHGPWLTALYKAASSSFCFLLVHFPRASQPEIGKQCSNSLRISFHSWCLF